MMRRGSLLGTDNQGLKGRAIVMNKDNFKQGMSHEEALKQSLGKEGLKDKKALSNLEKTQAGLPGRPDYDGKLTLSEANDWYKNGGGKPLYVDGAKIDLSPISNNDMQTGESRMVNYAHPTTPNIETGLVYGHIRVTKLDAQGNAKLGLAGGLLDNYGFEAHEGGSKFRNAATRIGKAWADFSTGKFTGQQSYDIFVYGTGKLK